MRTGSRIRAASPANPLAPANPSDTSPLESAALEMRPAFSSLAIISSTGIGLLNGDNELIRGVRFGWMAAHGVTSRV